MQNKFGPSPSAYLFPATTTTTLTTTAPAHRTLSGTPQTPDHAPYTHTHFLLGSPHDHAALVTHPRPSSPYSATTHRTPGAHARIGYWPSSSVSSPLAVFPVPSPAYGAPLLKTQLGPPSWSAQTDIVPTVTMAISIPLCDRPAPSSASGRSSSARSAADGSGRGHSGAGSEGGRDPTPPEEGGAGEAGQRSKDAKKKTHPCWMCHKSFDRPSTLKKHLLVHTGEKAHACESCGRRFGVASNLNRHAKTCRVAHATSANAPPSASASASIGIPAATSAGNVPSPSQPTDATIVSSDATAFAVAGAVVGTQPSLPDPVDAASPASPTSVPRRSSRKRNASYVDEMSVIHPEPSPEAQSPSSAQSTSRPSRSRKRARRAPSPASWVPDSLKSFDLTPTTKGTPVPLPPVRPLQDTNARVVEERDSYDENAAASLYPYHPHGWKGRLPGPGLLASNVANRSGGQLLVFNNC